MNTNTTYLFIDASAVKPWVGILKSGQWLALHVLREQALESIFTGTNQCLNETGLSLKNIQGFIHCEGPGSVLGVRLSAMAINCWRAMPAWQNAEIKTYQSLHLIRVIILDQTKSKKSFHIISEARKNMWNCLSNQEPKIQFIEQNTLHQLEGTLHHYQQRKSWHQAPQSAHPFVLDLSNCAKYLYRQDIVTHKENPTIFEAHADTYKKWDHTRHR